MAGALKIAIIGDFNFTYNAHHATNLALEHSQNLLEIEVNHYWIRIHEAASLKPNQFANYDAIWIAPGPFENVFFLSGILQTCLSLEIPLLITGEAYKIFVELLISQNNINPNQEKLISDNLSPSDQFEHIEVRPVSPTLSKLYNSMTRTELTASRYSLYPQLINYLKDIIVDIEAVNQFDDPEIVSLKKHPFCVASMSNVQICSTREMPHPLITAFINYTQQASGQEKSKVS